MQCNPIALFSLVPISLTVAYILFHKIKPAYGQSGQAHDDNGQAHRKQPIE